MAEVPQPVFVIIPVPVIILWIKWVFLPDVRLLFLFVVCVYIVRILSSLLAVAILLELHRPWRRCLDFLVGHLREGDGL